MGLAKASEARRSRQTALVQAARDDMLSNGKNYRRVGEARVKMIIVVWHSYSAARHLIYTRIRSSGQ
jgi:hypothetical protein